MGGVSKSGTETDVSTTDIPGIFGAGKARDKSRQLGGDLESILQSIGTGSGGSQAFLSELLNPTFGAQNANEQSFLNEIMSQTQGASALRGLGPSTQGGLAQNLAPELIGLQQKRLQNLGQGAQFEQGQRQQAIQGLFELLGFAQPQTIATQDQKTKGINAQISAAEVAALACWVADELFGVKDIRTICARYYASTTDSWFMRLYIKYGKSWAGFLKRNPIFKPLVAPIWFRMAIKGARKLNLGAK